MYPIYMCYYCRWFQISVHVALQPAIFELQTILKKKMARITPKWLWITPKRHHKVKCTTHVLLVTMSHKIHYFSLLPAVFELHVQINFDTSAPNDLKITWSTLFLYDHPFSRTKVVDNRKYTKWPLNDLEHLVNSTLYTLNTNFGGPHFTCFTLRSAVQDIRLSKVGKIGNAPNYLRLILKI